MNSTRPEDVHCNMDETLAINVQQTQLVTQKQSFICNNSCESFNKLLSDFYGEEIKTYSKKLDNLRQKRAKLMCTLAFLKRCRDSDVIPVFIKTKHQIKSLKAERIMHRAELALLRERIQDTRSCLDVASRSLLELHLQLSSILSPDHWRKLDSITMLQAEKVYLQVSSKHIKKYELLMEKQVKRRQEPTNETTCVMNLSSVPLDRPILSVLEKGLGFAIAPKKVPKEEIVSSVEAAVRSLQDVLADEIRSDVAHILNKAKPPRPNVTREEFNALKSIRSNEDVVVLKADKGNCTVVMNTSDYKDKMETLLSTGSYKEIKRNPTSGFVAKVKSAVKIAPIPDEKKKQLVPSAPKIPKIYGLPKVHKNEVPLRPIVSAIDSPTYSLGKYLAGILTPLTGSGPSFVKDSKHFVERIETVHLDSSDILVSFDVESLFTNVPIDKALEVIQQRLENNGQPKELTKLAELCLRSTYFVYDGKFYSQTEGAAMGSPLSPVVANMFMEDFEDEALRVTPLKPKMWLRYVDDTFIIWQHGKDSLMVFLEFLNSRHPNIKFTYEIEQDGKLPFLDVLVSRKHDGSLSHTVYRKPTHTGRYLHATSHHHPSQKQAMINTLVHRAKQLCEPDSLQEEVKHLKKTMKINGYGSWKIDKCLRPRQMRDQDNTRPLSTVTLPYVKGTTDKIANVLRKNNIRVVFNTSKKIGQCLRRVKDAVPLESEGIYSVPCPCGVQYIGETKRNVSQRIKEHIRADKYNQLEKSAIAEHAHRTNHMPAYDRVKVLNNEKRYWPRKIKEAVEIFKTTNNINRDDSYRLPNIWKAVLKNSRTSNIGSRQVLADDA